jgi:hypothetical protein
MDFKEQCESVYHIGLCEHEFSVFIKGGQFIDEGTNTNFSRNALLRGIKLYTVLVCKICYLLAD